MAIVLETLAADGAVLLRTPLVVGVTLVSAQPDVTYRVVNEFGGRVAPSALVKRIDADLRIDLPEDRSVSLEGFFTRCTPENPCALSMENIGGTAAETVTPATLPVAELAEGGLLMYASGAPAAAVPAPESGFSFKPVLGIAGAVAILGAAGGGSGGGGSSGDTIAPAAPELTSSALTRLAQPVFAGTAEAGATVTLTLFDANPVTYETTAGSDGAWRIDTALDSPRLGTPITLVEGIPVPLSLIATDAAGNASAIASSSVTLDSVLLAAPIITSPLLTADTTPVIRGIAEPGARVSVALDVGRDGAIDATWVATAQASGEWSIDVGTPPASGALPDGQLANLSSTGLVVTASDDAGNQSPSTTAVLQVDTSLPAEPTIDSVAGDNAVNALEAGASVTITGTVPEAVRSVTVSWGAAALAATVTGNTWTAVFAPAQVPADGSTSVVASYVSADGTTSAEAARAVLVDRLAPGAPTIAQVPESSGGINAAEAADGTLVRIGLGGSGAVAGDRVVLQWGGATLTHTLSGTEIGGNVATVNVSAATIDAQGDGTFGIIARIVDVAGNEGASSAAFPVTVDRTAPTATAQITAIVDDAPLVTGTVADNGVTNDTTPTITGVLSAGLAAGEAVEPLRNGQPTGLATVSGSTWRFDDSGLANGGAYTYTARVVDAGGNRSGASDGYTIRVDTAAPAYALRDADVYDNVRPDRGTVRDGGLTNDTRPELRLRLDSLLSNGESLRVFRASGSADAVLVGTASFDRRDEDFPYSYTEGSALARGTTYTYSADVVDAAGNVAQLALDYSITVI